MVWNTTSLERIFGVIFAPIAWVIGSPWRDCAIVGNLLGTRMALNELVAFSILGTQKELLDPRSFTIATFALCGFANLSSIGIQIGGIGALAPEADAAVICLVAGLVRLGLPEQASFPPPAVQVSFSAPTVFQPFRVSPSKGGAAG